MAGSLGVLALLAAVALAVGGVARLLDRRIPALVLASFFVLACLPFPRAFAGGDTPLPLDHIPLTHPWLPLGVALPHNPYLNDLATLFLPWAKAVRLAWEHGELPLRDRWNGCGTPLAANGQSAAFSPFTLLGLLLPLLSAFLLTGAAKLGLAIAGMWLWLRELGLTRRSAYFAAVAFGLSLTFSHFLFFPQATEFALWPWMLFVAERCRDRQGRVRAFLALTGVFAFAVLAGHSQSLIIGVSFLAVWILARRLARDLPDAGRLIGIVGGSGAAAAGLTAFVLIPSLVAIRASNRLLQTAHPHWTPLLSWAPHGPIWTGLVTPFFPGALGDLIHGPVIPGATGAIPEMDLACFGIVAWAAALLIFRPGSPRPRAEWALVAVAVCGLGNAVAQWPFAEIFALLPGIRYTFPLRFYSWVALAGPAIAAFELDRYARDVAARPRTAWVAAAVPLFLAGAAFGVYKLFWSQHDAVHAVAFQRQETKIALAVLAAAALLLFAMRVRPTLAVAGLALLSAGDLLHHWRPLYARWPASLLYPETAMVRFLHSRSDAPFRIGGVENAIYPNMGVFAGVEDVRTFDPVERGDYVAFLDATCGFPPSDYFKHIRNPDAPVFDFLNVRYMISAPDGHSPGSRWSEVYAGKDGNVYENASVLPRAFVPERVSLVAAPAGLREPVADANAAFGPAFGEIAANRDWRGRAWILWDAYGDTSGGQAEVSDYSESTNAISFRARVSGGPAAVVVSVVQDGGWSGVDAGGAKVDLRRANGPFFAAVLLPGDHSVRLTYRPPGFTAGLVVAGAAAAGLLLLAWRSRRP